MNKFTDVLETFIFNFRGKARYDKNRAIISAFSVCDIEYPFNSCKLCNKHNHHYLLALALQKKKQNTLTCRRVQKRKWFVLQMNPFIAGI